MPAYSFKRQFIEPILDGRKLQTIRPVGRRRHARVGERMQLYTGMRTKSCKLIATRICWSVEQIDLHIRPLAVITARIDGVLLDEIATIKLAHADGFGTLADMWAFWRENHKGIDHFQGLLIKWEPGNVR